LNGYKAYIAGFGSIAFGIIGWLTGNLDGAQAGQAIIAGFGIIGLRHGITKSGS
jgi:hypothetical protein